MKKLIICFLLLLLALPAYGGQTLYTSGTGYFAITKAHLERADRLDRRGQYEALNAAINTRRILAPFQGQAVEVESYRRGIYRVRFPGSKTVWWTNKEGLMNRGEESHIR